MPAPGFRILGLPQFQKAMERRQKELAHRERTNAQATVLTDAWIQRNFEEQGKRTMGGDGWKPLASSTIANRKRNKGGNIKILMDSGHLKTKWKHLWTASMAKIQSGADYGKYHDDPVKPRKKIPLRRILPTNEQIWPLIQKLYGDLIKRVLR